MFIITSCVHRSLPPEEKSTIFCGVISQVKEILFDLQENVFHYSPGRWLILRSISTVVSSLKLSSNRTRLVVTTFSESCVVLLLRPANEVCEGYVFTRVCHSVHRGGCAWSRGVPGSGGCLLPGGCLVPGGVPGGWGGGGGLVVRVPGGDPP